MDVGTLSSWVALAVTVLVTIYTWYSNSQRADKEDIRRHEVRLTQIESKVGSLPDKDAFHKVEMAVTEMRGGMKVLEAEFKPTASSVKRIEDYLLNNIPANGRVSKR